MKGKSLIVQIFTLAILMIAAYSGLFSASSAAWLGVASLALTLTLNSPLLSSGSWPSGWAPVMWISNIGGILLQVLSQIGEKNLIEPNIVNYVIIGINLLLFTFIKDYGTGTSIVQKR